MTKGFVTKENNYGKGNTVAGNTIIITTKAGEIEVGTNTYFTTPNGKVCAHTLNEGDLVGYTLLPENDWEAEAGMDAEDIFEMFYFLGRVLGNGKVINNRGSDKDKYGPQSFLINASLKESKQLIERTRDVFGPQGKVRYLLQPKSVNIMFNSVKLRKLWEETQREGYTQWENLGPNSNETYLTGLLDSVDQQTAKRHTFISLDKELAMSVGRLLTRNQRRMYTYDAVPVMKWDESSQRRVQHSMYYKVSVSNGNAQDRVTVDKENEVIYIPITRVRPRFGPLFIPEIEPKHIDNLLININI